MTKRDHLKRAILKTEEAIAKLRIAKQELLHARSDQHIRLALALAAEAEVDRLRHEIEILREQLEQRCARA